MENNKKSRTVRPVKPKTIPVETPVVVPVVVSIAELPAKPQPEVEQPVVVPVDNVVASTPVVAQPESPEVQHKVRVQTNKTIGVSISSARVRRHLDKLNINAKLDSLINELKTPLNEYKSAKTKLETGKTTQLVESVVNDKVQLKEVERDITSEERQAAENVVSALGGQFAELEMKVLALSRERTRFSNEASIALSIICDELIQQLVSHTMDRVLAAKKKIIQISHLHEPGVEKLSLYPLIKSLPSFLKTTESLEKLVQSKSAEKALSNALSQAEKEFKKKYQIHTPKKRKSDEVPPTVVIKAATPEEVEEDLPEDEPSDSKTSFKFYVQQVCKELLKREPKYKAVRISTEIRSYLSDLIVELIQRLSSLVLLTANSMKNKTVNDIAILRTVEILLIDGHVGVESITYKEAIVPDPVLVKAEIAKRDAEKEQGREYKVEIAKIPTVKGLSAVHTITYSTSGYPALYETVQKKLELYKAYSSESLPADDEHVAE